MTTDSNGLCDLRNAILRAEYDDEVDEFMITEGNYRFIRSWENSPWKEIKDLAAATGSGWKPHLQKDKHWIKGPAARAFMAENFPDGDFPGKEKRPAKDTAEDARPDVVALYKHERKAEWTSKQALKRALTFAAWERLGGYIWNHGALDSGVNTQTATVRLVVSDDPEGYDASYIDDCADVRECERVKIKDDIKKRIDFSGVVIVCAEWWNGAEWEHSDSYGGFIGNEWQGSGYDINLMQTAMDDYNKPLYAVEIILGYYEITNDRDELLTACMLLGEIPEEAIFTISHASLRNYRRVNACLYCRKED